MFARKLSMPSGTSAMHNGMHSSSSSGGHTGSSLTNSNNGTSTSQATGNANMPYRRASVLVTTAKIGRNVCNVVDGKSLIRGPADWKTPPPNLLPINHYQQQQRQQQQLQHLQHQQRQQQSSPQQRPRDKSTNGSDASAAGAATTGPISPTEATVAPFYYVNGMADEQESSGKLQSACFLCIEFGRGSSINLLGDRIATNP